MWPLTRRRRIFLNHPTLPLLPPSSLLPLSSLFPLLSSISLLFCPRKSCVNPPCKAAVGIRIPTIAQLLCPLFRLYETPGAKRAPGARGGIAASPEKAPTFAPGSLHSKHQAHGHNSQTRSRWGGYYTVAARFLLGRASPCYESRA